jgi:hypothetical protein
MAENSSKTRRNFLKTVGAAGVAGLAGCNGLGGNGSERADNGSATEDPGPPNPTDTQNTTENDTQGYTENDTQDYTENDSQGSTENDTQDSPEEDTGEPDPSYSIQGSPLQYDLTDLATSETYSHDEAYIRDNYSAELGVTVLEDGEEVSLEELGDVHLENEEGEQVHRTEDGYVPEYAVEDGEELTVKAEVDGETLEDTVTVNKELPNLFYADARLVENGEVLYDTDWTTPYSFDANIGENGEVTEDNTYQITRQQFHQQRTQKRNELAGDELILESDLETWRGYFEEDEDELTEEEKKEYYLGGLGYAMEGGEHYEGTGADDNAFNVEKAMLEHSPYEPVFIGGFTNPKEPDVPGAGDGDGYPVDSQVAYVEGDWYHVGKDNAGARHISEIDEIGLVGDQGGNYGAVSVLAEFERGNTELLNYEDADEIVETAVTSPVTLNGNMTELELSNDISWNTLKEIRDNTDWEQVMVPMELATAIGNNVEGSVSMEGETTSDSRLRVNTAFVS